MGHFPSRKSHGKPPIEKRGIKRFLSLEGSSVFAPVGPPGCILFFCICHFSGSVSFRDSDDGGNSALVIGLLSHHLKCEMKSPHLVDFS